MTPPDSDAHREWCRSQRFDAQGRRLPCDCKPDSDEREVRQCETCGAAYMIYPGQVRRFVILEPLLAQRIHLAAVGQAAREECAGFPETAKRLYALADELRERMRKK